MLNDSFSIRTSVAQPSLSGQLESTEPSLTRRSDRIAKKIVEQVGSGLLMSGKWLMYSSQLLTVSNTPFLGPPGGSSIHQGWA